MRPAINNHRIIDRFLDDYAFLSNFYYTPIEYKSILFPTTEHAFQWSKAADKFDKLEILHAASPAKAKRITRGKDFAPIKNWTTKRLQIMEEILLIKFSRKSMRDRLLATGDAILIEGNWWGDTYWGVCRGVGENHLGKLLMKIRNKLRHMS